MILFSVKSLEKAKQTGQFAVAGPVSSKGETLTSFDEESESESEDDSEQIVKKIKLT